MGKGTHEAAVLHALREHRVQLVVAGPAADLEQSLTEVGAKGIARDGRERDWGESS